MWPVGLLGVVEYWKRGELRIMPGALIAVGLFIGAYFGARLTGAISQLTMKRLYGTFLLVVGIYFLYSSRGGSKPGTEAKFAPGNEPVAVRPLPAAEADADQVQRPPDLSW
jgi:uncharacterized membrane protein YfcA